jgi:hypothetical protein
MDDLHYSKQYECSDYTTVNIIQLSLASQNKCKKAINLCINARF